MTRRELAATMTGRNLSQVSAAERDKFKRDWAKAKRKKLLGLN